MVGGFGWAGGGFGSFGSFGGVVSAVRKMQPPAIVIKSLLIFGEKSNEGRLIQAVTVPWREIIGLIQRDPAAVYQIDPFKWEEIIAGAYKRAGFDEVILTPRSGDGGKDIIATKRDYGSIRIYDQVKAYKPDHLVTANDVRAMLGVMSGSPNVSKGIITTTSRFAPRINDDQTIAQFLPYRLELKDKDALLSWLDDVSRD